MRKGWILAPALLAGITLFLASDLFAWGDRGGKRGGPYWQGSSAEQNWSGPGSRYAKRGPGKRGYGMMGPGMRGPGGFMFIEMQQMMSESIAELSGKSVDEISADLKTHSMRALLMKYEINLDKLHETMKPKVEAFINIAAEEGRITQQERDAQSPANALIPVLHSKPSSKRNLPNSGGVPIPFEYQTIKLDLHLGSQTRIIKSG